MAESRLSGEVWIVDDDLVNLKLLARILTSAGYQVRQILDGYLALRKIQEQLPELILLDVAMPGLDGYEVCRHLKANPETRPIPVIFISALDDDAEKVLGFQAGGVDYITKPFHAEEVLARVQTHIHLRRMQLDLEARNADLLAEIAERKRAEDALRESEERYRSVVQTAMDAILTVDERGEIIAWNHGAEQIFQYSEAEILGKPFFILMPEQYHGMHNGILERVYTGQTQINGQAVQVVGLRKDGSEFPVEIVLSVWTTRNELFLTAIIRDTTERKQAEDALRFQSTHDILTGLFNRQYYEAEIERLQPSRRYPITFLMMDVDGLKEVNDTLGHSAGDELLRGLAQVLKTTFRPEDMIARVGGDEFVVILPNTNAAAAEKIVRRLKKNLGLRNQNSTPEQTLNLSIGAASCDAECVLSDVFIQADQAMYREKEDKKKKAL